MKYALLLVPLIFIAAPAVAEPMKSQIYEGYQRPPKPPPPTGYVTKDGTLVGSCKNIHNRRHQHCKVPREDAPAAKPAQNGTKR